MTCSRIAKEMRLTDTFFKVVRLSGNLLVFYLAVGKGFLIISGFSRAFSWGNGYELITLKPENLPQVASFFYRLIAF